MHIIPLSQLEVRNRRRSAIAPGPLQDLKTGILSVGNLHPPVCWFDRTTDKWVLTVGERRTRAIAQIAKDGLTYYANNQPIQPGYIAILELSEFLDEGGRLEAEIYENIQRVDFDWKDRIQALAALHDLRHATTGQSMKATAEEIVAEKGGAVSGVHHAIKDAKIIARHLGNEKIANARNATEAKQLIEKAEQERVNAALARKIINSSSPGPIQIVQADLLQHMAKLPEAFVDLILTDPPYGIAASGGGFSARTIHHHNYDDSVENARDIARCILVEGLRVTKARANLFMFTDIKHWEWLQATASNMGWTPFRFPIFWQKSEGEGLAPWGSAGPRITTELIFFATKGERGLHSSPTNVFTVPRVARNERLHAAEKPVELLRRLIRCATLPGDFILDPCCGSGSALIAAKEERRSALGLELDADYYTTAMANVFGKDILDV